jgi:uncharacterized protein (TIGR02246 family)
MLRRILVVALLCSGATGGAFGASADEAGIRANVAAFETAWNKRDMGGVAATYAPDGDVVVFDGPRVTGREAIRKMMEAELSTTPASKRISLTVISIRVIGQDVAIADTVARFNEGPVQENRGTSVLVRRGGTWLIAALRVFAAQRP